MTRLPCQLDPLRMQAGRSLASAAQFLRKSGRFALLSIAACSLLVPPARAGAYPESVVATDAACHGSVREAAVAGILLAAGLSRKVEYGGAVFQRDAHCFVHSVPVTSHQPSSVEYIIRPVAGRMLLTGIFHTHTPGGHVSEFSQRDRVEQRRLGIPSYVGAIGARGEAVTIRALGEMVASCGHPVSCGDARRIPLQRRQ